MSIVIIGVDGWTRALKLPRLMRASIQETQGRTLQWMAPMSRQTSQRRAFRPSLEAMEPIILLATNGAIVESLTQPGGFTTNGSAVLSSSGARMTNALDQSSSVWFNNLLTSDHYTVSFNFSLSNPGGVGWADGFTFAVADAAKTGNRAVGTVGDGEGIGYRGMSGYAIEFDTYYNSYKKDPAYTHVGLDLNGSMISTAVSKPLPFEIKGVGTVTASITYASGSITVSIAKPGGTFYQVLSATVPKSAIPATGRVGLTAATAAGKETAYISNFSFIPEQQFKIDVTIFIPGVYAPNPRDSSTIYGGDNHAFGPAEAASSNRARQEVTLISGDQNAGIKQGSEVDTPGTSRLYYATSLDSTGHLKAGTQPIAQKQADGSQMHVYLVSATKNDVLVHMVSNVSNGLEPLAPGSSWGLYVEINTAGPVPRYSIKGLRSQFPAFEIDVNNQEVVASPPRNVPFYGPYSWFWLAYGLVTPEDVNSAGTFQ